MFARAPPSVTQFTQTKPFLFINEIQVGLIKVKWYALFVRLKLIKLKTFYMVLAVLGCVFQELKLKLLTVLTALNKCDGSVPMCYFKGS